MENLSINQLQIGQTYNSIIVDIFELNTYKQILLITLKTNKMRQCNYSIIDEGTDCHGIPYILLQDSDTGVTITNAAETVIEELGSRAYGKRIFYTDTDGQTDELSHDNNGNFIKFKFGNTIGL